MQTENGSMFTALSRRTHMSKSSKISSLDGLVERPPMADISNKLHAMVDEFVSNLSSECDNLVNNVSGEAHQIGAPGSAPADPKPQRPSNRTTSEVLNGLKRPSITPPASFHHRDSNSHAQHAKPALQATHNKKREEGKNLRYMRDKPTKSIGLQILDDLLDIKGGESEFEDILSRDEESGRGTRTRMGTKGRVNHAVEVLSSDSASEDRPRPRPKYSARTRATQPAAKGRASNLQGRSRKMESRSPSRSLESSHLMDYGYEEDTPSIGGTSPCGDMLLEKLRWPSDIGGSHSDGETGKKLEFDDVQCHTEAQNRNEPKDDDGGMEQEEDDESHGEDTGRNPHAIESDGEELPVLPKVLVKRKVMNEPRASERRSQRGRTQSGSPQTRKQRTPQIDASVITQLEFGKRPQNCVSDSTS